MADAIDLTYVTKKISSHYCFHQGFISYHINSCFLDADMYIEFFGRSGYIKTRGYNHKHSNLSSTVI